tara:strand:+ start:2756 stop:2908 length:153 start_codon:yes stop_codon:yes gene_type:complete
MDMEFKARIKEMSSEELEIEIAQLLGELAKWKARERDLIINNLFEDEYVH